MNVCRFSFRSWFSGYRVALSAMLLATALMLAPCSMRGVAAQPAPAWPANDRMAAWQQTIAGINTEHPNAFMMTYMIGSMGSTEQWLLAKFVPGVESPGGVQWPGAAQGAAVRDLDGGVAASWRAGQTTVTCRIMPVLTDRAGAWEGAVVYRVQADPPAPVVVRVGGGINAFMHGDPAPLTHGDWLTHAARRAEVVPGGGLLSGGPAPLTVAVRGDGAFTRQAQADGGEYLEIRLESGQGWLVAAFAADPARARALAEANPADATRRVEEYYSAMLSGASIATPDPAMNTAFRQAVVTLEYNWLAPLGWIEGMHHWVTLWHMQQTGAADWLGQHDRAGACIMEHGRRQLPGGAIPHLQPGGEARRDFGGHNQFYFWEVRNHLLQTADTAAARELAPILDRALAQTWAEYDADGDGLLAWGKQIGNQEDLFSTPYGGASPAIEGINMLCTRAAAARLLGDAPAASALETRVRELTQKLRGELWLTDLGRFAYMKDPRGIARLESQYHTYLYPAIFGIVDPLDAWTGLRHLRERLTGPNSEVYCSNNFPDHLTELPATWGMQAGAAQQPWAAWGLAAAGLRNEAWRPLAATAAWVTNDYQRGAWPEVANERRLGYFSPPAGLYIQSCVEALFGLKADLPASALDIAPCFPDAWPSAELKLPEYQAQYRREGNTLTYTVASQRPLALRLRWMLPPVADVTVKIDGKKAECSLEPGVECMILTLAPTAPATETTFEVRLEPLTYAVQAPASVAEGDPLTVALEGLTAERVEDRAGVLASVSTGEKGRAIQARVREGLLAPYEGYGRLGRMNFSRRTFFLLCKGEGQARFWRPVDLTLLPPVEAQVKGEVAADGALTLLARNNTAAALTGQGFLECAGERLPLSLDVAPRGERSFALVLSPAARARLSAGDNAATLALPDGRSIELRATAAALPAAPADGRYVTIDLPPQRLAADDTWNSVRDMFTPLNNAISLDALAANPEMTSPELPGVPLRAAGDKFVPVGARPGSSKVTLDLAGRRYRKLYLVVLPLLTSHELYTPVARIELAGARPHARDTGAPVLARTLYFPGDLDWFYPRGTFVRLSTWHGPRQDRHGLLPLLTADQGDWGDWGDLSRPPLFPQPAFWSRSPVVETPQALLSVIEVPLEHPAELESLTLTVLPTDAVLGLVAVTGELDR